jgi:hypothetical protein
MAAAELSRQAVVGPQHNFQGVFMQVIGTQIIPDQGGKHGFTVEFVGEGGEVVSVQLRNDEAQTLNRMNAVDKAKAIMVQLAAFDTDQVEVIKPDDAQAAEFDGKQSD